MTITKNNSKTSALILSGGGSRFGYYMGMYGALCEVGKQPDIIIASCGGTYISGLISLCSDPKIAKKMMLSRPFYEMLCRIQPIKPTDNKRLILKSAGKRWLEYKKAKFSLSKGSKVSKPPYQNKIPLPLSLIDKLHNQALYKITNESTDNPFWQSEQFLSAVKSEYNHASNATDEYKKVKTLIVASRTLEAVNVNGNINSNANNKSDGFLWQQVLCADDKQLTQDLQQLQSQGKLTARISDYSQHIIPELHINEDMPLEFAVRASINDMFYFPPISYKSIYKKIHQSHTMLGGAIDLLPIEMACQLVDTVYAERKSPFDKWVAEPAIQSVFGVFANDRRDDWHNFKSESSQSDNQINWIDTSDNSKALPPVLIRKPKPIQGYINLEYPSYEAFEQIMTAQYDYGYGKIMQAKHGYRE